MRAGARRPAASLRAAPSSPAAARRPPRDGARAGAAAKKACSLHVQALQIACAGRIFSPAGRGERRGALAQRRRSPALPLRPAPASAYPKE